MTHGEDDARKGKHLNKGIVQTVLETVEPDSLGIVLPHEHLFIDMSGFFIEPSPEYRELAHQPITLGNLSWIRSHRMNNLFNLEPFPEELAIEEAHLFKKAGGGTIVEQTPINVGRSPEKLVHVAQATGLKIIMGTAYYRETQLLSTSEKETGWEAKTLGVYPSGYITTATEDDLANYFVREITVGVGNTGIKAGFIGEIGCSWPLTANEKKVLHAGAKAQRRTGALLTVHPGFYEDSPIEIIQLLREAGADLHRVVISHMSIALGHHTTRLELARTGCYLEWDLFGWGGVFPQQPTPVDIPSDQGRLRQIIQMIDLGFLDQILISHDICAKIRLARYGGTGYAHLLENIVPIMRQKGMSEEQIHTIMVENPKRAFSLIEPKAA
jgi:phosphotriesterase-related protein